MPVARVVADWSVDIKHSLRAARRSNEQTQTECAAALRQLGAVPPPTQSDVSGWERGSVPSTESRRNAVHQYIAKAGLPDRRLGAESTFEGIVGTLASDRSQIVEDIQHRFKHGPPLSQDDGRVFGWLISFHGLETIE